MGITFNGTNGPDSEAGTAFNDTLLGNQGNDTLGGSLGADSIVGGVGTDSLIANGNDTINADNGNDSILFSGGNNSIIGGNAGDISFAGESGNFTLDRLEGETNTWIITGPGGASTVAGVSTFEGFDLVNGADTQFFVCFAEGTEILTDNGQKPVEALRGGDVLATVSGRGSPMKPLLWVGKRRVMLAGHPNADAVAPIRIKAGALGDHTPLRDLLVSPDHCMFFDGALVPARLLVNGTSIVVERGLSEVTYYHLELEQHDVVLAEGAPSESWLDCGNRAWFENAEVAMLKVGGTLEAAGTGFDEARACAPLVHGGEKLQAIRDAIALRALSAPAAEAERKVAAA